MDNWTYHTILFVDMDYLKKYDCVGNCTNFVRLTLILRFNKDITNWYEHITEHFLGGFFLYKNVKLCLVKKKFK